MGVGLILGGSAGYLENKLSPELTSGQSKDVIGVLYLGSCLFIPGLAFCFDAIGQAG